MNIQSKIERFIIEDLLVGGDRQSIAPNEPLITSGVIDSLGMLRLITFLEQDFNITIGDGDVLGSNFETVEKIAAFVQARQPNAAAN